MLPRDFPPFTTVQHCFYRLRDIGMLDIISEALVMAARLLAARSAEPATIPSIERPPNRAGLVEKMIFIQAAVEACPGESNVIE